MKVLTKNDILEANDIITRQVPVPEWGEDSVVLVRTMNGKARDQFSAALDKFREKQGAGEEKMPEGWQAALIASCVVGESGELLFSIEDVVALQGKSARALARIYSAAAELNGIGSKEQGELRKN